jgi:hypothetical protein
MFFSVEGFRLSVGAPRIASAKKIRGAKVVNSVDITICQ